MSRAHTNVRTTIEVGGTYYVVSTMTRRSSAIVYDHEYNETLVWLGKDLSKILYQDEAPLGSVERHLIIVAGIQDLGAAYFDKAEDE